LCWYEDRRGDLSLSTKVTDSVPGTRASQVTNVQIHARESKIFRIGKKQSPKLCPGGDDDKVAAGARSDPRKMDSPQIGVPI